jgi:hypothetical protein
MLEKFHQRRSAMVFQKVESGNQLEGTRQLS